MSFEDCIDKLEQLICDENKIVTYKMLSRELKIHVNKAKMYMFEFLMKQNLKANANLQVHYFLAGDVGQDNRKVMKVLVVSQDAVEQAKQKFRELTSCHIYSINKEKIMDECALYTADISYSKDIEEQNECSAIKHPSIEIQPPVLNKINIMKKDNESEFLKKQ
ncbi:DNA polymerase delta subunit 3, partial [Stegodyphus mimosarum]